MLFPCFYLLLCAWTLPTEADLIADSIAGQVDGYIMQESAQPFVGLLGACSWKRVGIDRSNTVLMVKFDPLTVGQEFSP